MSISKRTLKSGTTYEVRFRYTCPTTGERKSFRRSCGVGISKAEARALERTWFAEVTAPPKEEQPTRKAAAFSGFAAHWLDTHGPKLKPSTRRGYDRAFRVYLVPAFGDRDLRSIGPEDVEMLQASMSEKLAPKTVNNNLGVLSAMYRAAVRWGYCESDPTELVPPLRVGQQAYRWWTRAQSERALKACREHRPQWVGMLATFLYSGLRFGELAALEWPDVHLGPGAHIHVQRACVEGVVGTPKNGTFRRVPIPSVLVGILRQHPRTMGTDLVFPGRNGYLTDAAVWKRVTKIADLAKLPRISTHDLRHSYASQLATAGTPLAAIREFLGHSDVRMTDRYAHLCPTERDRFVELLSARREGAGST